MAFLTNDVVPSRHGARLLNSSVRTGIHESSLEAGRCLPITFHMRGAVVPGDQSRMSRPAPLFYPTRSWTTDIPRTDIPNYIRCV